MGNGKFIFSVLLMLFLAACGGAATSDITATEPQIVQATDGETGIVEILLPVGWIAREAGQGALNLANSKDAFRHYWTNQLSIETGEIGGTISALSKATMPNTVENSLDGLAQWVGGRFTNQAEAVYSFGQVQRGSLNGREIAIIDGLATGSDGAIELRFILVDAGDAYGIILFAAPLLELEQSTAILEEIVSSFRFIPLNAD